REERSIMPDSSFKATFPLWGTVIILVITRIDALGIKAWLVAKTPSWNHTAASLGELHLSHSLVVQWRQIFGTELSWSHAILYVPSFLPFFLVCALTFALFR